MRIIDLENRKSEILKYLRNHYLASLREIADNYAVKRSNYSVVKKIVNELVKEQQIECLDTRLPFYYVTPTAEDVLDALLNIIDSDKIKSPRFQKIKFQYLDKPSLSQVAKNLISLYHLELKIFLHVIRKNKTYHKQTRRLKDTLKKFHIRFIDFWRKNTDFQYIETLQDGLDYLAMCIELVEFPDRIYFSNLRGHGYTLKKKINMLYHVIDDSFKEAALKYNKRKYDYKNKKKTRFETTPKYIRNQLAPLIDKNKKLDGHSLLFSSGIGEGSGMRNYLLKGRDNSDDIFESGYYVGSKVNPHLYKLMLRNVIQYMATLPPKERKIKEKMLKEKLSVTSPREVDFNYISRFLES